MKQLSGMASNLEVSIIDATREIYNHKDDQGNMQAACLVHNEKHFAWQANPAIWRSSGVPQVDTLDAGSFARFHYHDELSRLLKALEEGAKFHPGKDIKLTWKAIDMGTLKTHQYTSMGRLVIVDQVPCRLMKMLSKTALS
ncbi:MAG: hypothetical protein AAFO83_00050 [Cyanobacteria bacterium J06607_13]